LSNQPPIGKLGPRPFAILPVGGARGRRIRGEVLGWTALSPVSRRQVYAGVAEFSVYVRGNARAAAG